MGQSIQYNQSNKTVADFSYGLYFTSDSCVSTVGPSCGRYFTSDSSTAGPSSGLQSTSDSLISTVGPGILASRQ